jgi:Na+-driven multidrug efflux pump
MFLQNIGTTWSALITGIAKQGLFLIPALFLLHITLGLDGVLAAQPVSDLCSIFLAIPLWWKHYRKMDYLEKQKQ